MSRRRARTLLLAGGAVAAAVLAFGRGTPMATSVGTRSLPAAAAGPAAATGPASDAAGATADDRLLPPPRPRPAPTGEPPAVDLAHIVRQGDRYVAPLADGRTAILTLDPRLQEAAERVLDRSRAPRGAVVVTDRDGRILALAGRRTEATTGGTDGIVDRSLAVETWAPAASVFKVVTASALVESGVRPHDRVCFHGGVRSVMESNLTDSKRDRRCEDLDYGVARSQNAIIAKLTHQHLTPERLTETARKFGFGTRLPVAATADFGQADIPTDDALALARTAAGFEGVHLSALGGAMLAGTIAGHGRAPAPRLVAAVIDGGREVAWPAAGPGRRVLDARVADQVAAMMVSTCKSGSAARAFNGRERIRDVRVAGKTGTLSRTKPFYLQYSWFVGFAPADDPQLAIAVVLGNAELWHLKAHTAARTVLAAGL